MSKKKSEESNKAAKSGDQNASEKPKKSRPAPATPGTTSTIEESWKRINKWLKKNAPDWDALNKKASKKAIKEAEALLGMPLPEELNQSYSYHDGGNQIFPTPDPLDIGFYLMPLDEVGNDWTIQKELLDIGEFAGEHPESAKGIRKAWWNVGWIPFASNGGGDYFCIDMSPTSAGTIGQVISHNHETGEHLLLAPSLRQFLHQLASNLEEGMISYDEDEESLVYIRPLY